MGKVEAEQIRSAAQAAGQWEIGKLCEAIHAYLHQNTADYPEVGWHELHGRVLPALLGEHWSGRPAAEKRALTRDIEDTGSALFQLGLSREKRVQIRSSVEKSWPLEVPDPEHLDIILTMHRMWLAGEDVYLPEEVAGVVGKLPSVEIPLREPPVDKASVLWVWNWNGNGGRLTTLEQEIAERRVVRYPFAYKRSLYRSVKNRLDRLQGRVSELRLLQRWLWYELGGSGL